MSMLSLQKERRLLQVAVATACLVPIYAGFGGIFMGTGFLEAQNSHINLAHINLDSHFRYLSGLLLGIGLAFMMAIPDIENRRTRFRILTAIVVIGGAARLMGTMISDTPEASMQFALAMELIITPLLCSWQNSFARRWAATTN